MALASTRSGMPSSFCSWTIGSANWERASMLPSRASAVWKCWATRWSTSSTIERWRSFINKWNLRTKGRRTGPIPAHPALAIDLIIRFIFRGSFRVHSGTKTWLGTIRSPSHWRFRGMGPWLGPSPCRGGGLRGRPTQLWGSGHRRLPQPLTQGRLVEHLDQPLRQLRGVVRVEGQPRLPHDLRLRGVPAHDHQRPAVHRLEDRQAEALVERWEDERGTVPVKQPQRLIGDPAQQQERSSDIPALGMIADGRGVVGRVLAGDSQLVRLAEPRGEPREAVD